MTAELRARATLLVAGVLAGCASVPPEAGFDEAAALARERGGHELVWRRGGPEEAELDERVRELASAELTPESAVAIALLENRRLQAVYAELGFAQADVLAAARLPNPLFTAELRFPSGGGASALDLGLEQSFLSLLWMPLKKRMAAEAFEAAKLRVTEAALALATDVRIAYRRLQGAEQRLEVRHKALDAAEASLALAEALQAAGNLRKLDVDLERVPREEARVAESDAKLAVSEARETLTALLGLHGSAAELRVTAQLPEVPAEPGDTSELEGRAIEASLALAELRHELERVGSRLDLAHKERFVPDLTLGLAAEKDPDWELGPSLALPLPIFDQGQPELRRARAELERLQQTYLAEAVELRSHVRRTAARVLALHGRARFLEDVLVPLRRDVVDGLQREYSAMQEGAFRLLLAKRDELTATAESVASASEYWVAASELDGLLAGAPPRSSAAPTSAAFSSSSLSPLSSIDAH